MADMLEAPPRQIFIRNLTHDTLSHNQHHIQAKGMELVSQQPPRSPQEDPPQAQAHQQQQQLQQQQQQPKQDAGKDQQQPVPPGLTSPTVRLSAPPHVMPLKFPPRFRADKTPPLKTVPATTSAVAGKSPSNLVTSSTTGMFGMASTAALHERSRDTEGLISPSKMEEDAAQTAGKLAPHHMTVDTDSAAAIDTGMTTPSTSTTSLASSLFFQPSPRTVDRDFPVDPEGHKEQQHQLPQQQQQQQQGQREEDDLDEEIDDDALDERDNRTDDEEETERRQSEQNIGTYPLEPQQQHQHQQYQGGGRGGGGGEGGGDGGRSASTMMPMKSSTSASLPSQLQPEQSQGSQYSSSSSISSIQPKGTTGAPINRNIGGGSMRHRRISMYKGVCYIKAREKWEVHIYQHGKKKHIGYYDLEIDAAKAYDAAVIKKCGKRAVTNFDQVRPVRANPLDLLPCGRRTDVLTPLSLIVQTQITGDFNPEAKTTLQAAALEPGGGVGVETKSEAFSVSAATAAASAGGGGGGCAVTSFDHHQQRYQQQLQQLYRHPRPQQQQEQPHHAQAPPSASMEVPTSRGSIREGELPSSVSSSHISSSHSGLCPPPSPHPCGVGSQYRSSQAQQQQRQQQQQQQQGLGVLNDSSALSSEGRGGGGDQEQYPRPISSSLPPSIARIRQSLSPGETRGNEGDCDYGGGGGGGIDVELSVASTQLQRLRDIQSPLSPSGKHHNINERERREGAEDRGGEPRVSPSAYTPIPISSYYRTPANNSSSIGSCSSKRLGLLDGSHVAASPSQGHISYVPVREGGGGGREEEEQGETISTLLLQMASYLMQESRRLQEARKQGGGKAGGGSGGGKRRRECDTQLGRLRKKRLAEQAVSEAQEEEEEENEEEEGGRREEDGRPEEVETEGHQELDGEEAKEEDQEMNERGGREIRETQKQQRGFENEEETDVVVEETEEDRIERLALANDYNKALFYVAAGGETVRRLLRSATQGSFTRWDLVGCEKDRQAMVQILLSGMKAAQGGVGRGGGGEIVEAEKAGVISGRVAL